MEMKNTVPVRRLETDGQQKIVVLRQTVAAGSVFNMDAKGL